MTTFSYNLKIYFNCIIILNSRSLCVSFQEQCVLLCTFPTIKQNQSSYSVKFETHLESLAPSQLLQILMCQFEVVMLKHDTLHIH